MQQKQLHILDSMPVKNAVMKLALPTILGMIVQIFYNVTDTFFVGQLNDPRQIAAVAIAMPLFMIQMAISGIFGHGGASYLSRLLGQKNYAMAGKTASTVWVSCALASIVVAITGVVNMDALLNISGASTETSAFAASYLRIIFAGNIFIMLNFMASQLLRAEGAAKEAMFGMLLGTVTNIILDPIFIIVLKKGVAGAAIATIIGNAVGLFYYLSHYLRHKGVISLSLSAVSTQWSLHAEVWKIGIPASLAQILMSVGMATANNLASGHGDNAVAAMGIGMRVFSLPVFIFLGLALGVQPLIGYCYGAKNFSRLKESMKVAGSAGCLLVPFFVLLFALFPEQLVRIFIKDAGVVDVGVQVLRAFVFAIPFIPIQMLFMNALQSMGKGVPSLIISISRQGLIFIPALFVLNAFFGFSGLIYAIPLSDLGTMLIAGVFFLRVIMKFEDRGNTKISLEQGQCA